eukprot:Phypoly_transcript_12851.p1 GENE.Phypoly_transcript_12851~~Phypoly_transcript_12851.p1  ORF type:complete len:225 (+),score=32.16 Phypoly_transcript_12851:317-991(+)
MIAKPDLGDIHTHRREHCFLLRSGSSTTREYYWAAENKVEFDKWFTILNVCINEIIATSTKIGPHCLKKVHFPKPTICAKCSSLISGYGKQGFMCKVCCLCVHKKCEHKLGDYCMKIIQETNQQATPAKKDHFGLGRLSQYHPNHTVHLDVKQLRQVMAEFENEEKLLIETINTKYDLQANEIYDELFLRYQAEVHPVELKAERAKQELLHEIQIREAALKEKI